MNRDQITAIQETAATPQAKALYFYGKFVEEEGLFGKAFHGHKASKKERRRLAHLWQRAMKLGGMDEQGPSEAPEPRPVPGPGTHQGDPLGSDGSGSATE